MSTVRVGELNEEPLAESLGRLSNSLGSNTLELPASLDMVEFFLCLLLGATILRCFYAGICKGGSKSKEA